MTPPVFKKRTRSRCTCAWKPGGTAYSPHSVQGAQHTVDTARPRKPPALHDHDQQQTYTCFKVVIFFFWNFFSDISTMVNTGRPSGACGVCRERRIKCDETKPACLKCIRSGRSCTGYSHGLRLRDQTQKTIIKAKLGKPRGRRQGNASQDFADGPSTGSSKTAPRVSSIESSQAAEPARPRSFSVPSRSAHRSVDGENRGHKRCSSGPIAKTADSWSLEALMGDDTTSGSSPWQMIDIPLVVS